MPLTEPDSDVVHHRTAVRPPEDLDEFWSATFAETAAAAGRTPLDVHPVETGLRLVDTYDVCFAGFAGDPVRAWLHLPRGGEAAPLPLVVSYQGYGGGRGLAHEQRPWVLAGHPTLEVDSRGQGSVWRVGHTPDPHGAAPAHPGFLTRGLPTKEGYYYRRLFTDALCATGLSGLLPGTDGRVIVSGSSQGGALALAASALAARFASATGGRAPRLLGALVDVPFLADIVHAAAISDDGPYPELAAYLAIQRGQLPEVVQTLAYFDVAVLAAQATVPALFSVAMMDRVCPPSSVYAAYNAYGGPKTIEAYPFNGHEGGGTFHEVLQLAFLDSLLGPR